MRLPLSGMISAGGILLWGAMIILPLVWLGIKGIGTEVSAKAGNMDYSVFISSAAKSFLIGGLSVTLGYWPGRLLAESSRRGLVFILLLMPLALPSYVLYYAWSLPLDPTTELGRRLCEQSELAGTIGIISSATVLCLWHWPVAALLIGQGFRRIGPGVLERAKMEAPYSAGFMRITLPLVSGAAVPALVVCFMLVMTEYTTFHLSGAKTIGTELGIVYQTTGSSAAVAKAGWPMMIAALGAGAVLAATASRWQKDTDIPVMTGRKQPKRMWILFFTLCAVSWLAPVGMMAGAVRNTEPFRDYLALHTDELGYSILIGAVTGLLSMLLAGGVERFDWGFGIRDGKIKAVIQTIVYATVFAGMLMPGAALAAGLLEMCSATRALTFLREGWAIVCFGQTARIAGIVLIVLILTRRQKITALAERASMEGLWGFQLWWTVYRPFVLPLMTGVFLLTIMLSMTEIPATMLLLPAGLPNFAQRLLNQMHYARDQQVIASCLIMCGVFGILAAVMAGYLYRIGRLSKGITISLMALAAIFCFGGCVPQDGESRPDVTVMFGGTGGGNGEFVYPRAIEIAADGSVFIVDKTARIQRFTGNGVFITSFQMPEFEKGKPTGVSISPDGRIFVADTHYHRVMVFDQGGKELSRFGSYGKDNGQFIYPTDAAFGPDGRIYVSEYGGNDRISVFDPGGKFIFSFGSFGDGQNQLTRPQALCADWKAGVLYVADACNHRIAIYDFEGNLKSYFGSAGTGMGQLRYPYGLWLLPDGKLAVCEYGNNRIQLFTGDGKSLAVYGSAGRGPGQLAFPWSLAADKKGNIFIVDAGNNRIQKWRM